MIADTLALPHKFNGAIMREYEFDRDDEVLTKDNGWRRLFWRVHPNVRRDIIGWMGLAKSRAIVEPQVADTREDLLADYVNGASLVLDLLPNRASNVAVSDAEAIASDLRHVCGDMRLMAEFIDRLGRTPRDGQTRN